MDNQNYLKFEGTVKPLNCSLTHYVKDTEGQEYFVKEVWIQPGERALCTLPDFGRGSFEKMQLILSRDWEWSRDVDVNHTNQAIRVFEGEWLHNGLPCGMFWEEHLRLETLTPIENLN